MNYLESVVKCPQKLKVMSPKQVDKVPEAVNDVEYLETELILTRMVQRLTKEVTTRYNNNHFNLDMPQLNKILKSNIAFAFRVKSEEIPDFFLNEQLKSVVINIKDLSILIYNIVQSFNNDFGPKKHWEWS